MLFIFKILDPNQPIRSESPSSTSNAVDDRSRGPNSAAVALGCLFAITLLILVVTILIFVVLFLKKKIPKHEHNILVSNPGNVPHTYKIITRSVLYSNYLFIGDCSRCVMRPACI